MPEDPNCLVEFSNGSLWLTGEITDESAHQLSTLIHQVEQEKVCYQNQGIELRLNSHGGSVNVGLRLHDAIRRSPLLFTIIAEGWVASSAILVMCAGTHIAITPNTFLLIHEFRSEADCQYSSSSRYQEYLDDLMDRILVILNSRLNQPVRREDIEKDWFITAEKAVELGLADEIT